MSWSVYATDTKEKVRTYAEAEFDRQAKQYVATAEYDDVVNAKLACLSSLDAMDTTTPNSYMPVGSIQGVKVEACGSRCSTSVSVMVKTERIWIFA